MRRRTLLAAAAAYSLPLAAAAQKSPEPNSADIVIAGAGGAGLSAALTAAQAGMKVILIEKGRQPGGDTLISGGYFNAAEAGREGDSAHRHLEDTLKFGRGYTDPEVAAAFVARAPETLAWLRGLGMKFVPGVTSVFGGGFPRAHKPLSSRGSGYVTLLTDACKRAGVDLRTDTTLLDLAMGEDGEVAGIIAEPAGGQPYQISASHGVILACGGFGASSEMIERHAPHLKDIPTDARPGLTGDAHRIAEQHGIRLVNMQFVECVPGSVRDIDIPLRLDYNPHRMIFVNRDGRRFVQEDSARDTLRDATVSQPGRAVWSITDTATVGTFDILDQKHLFQGHYAGFVFREKTLEALAARIGVPAAALEETVRSYRAQPGNAGKLSEPPFWALEIRLKTHTTLGGIAVNARMQCLDAQGKPMKNLYAAGELVGNIHGANRMGGNGISAAITTGRIAALCAAGRQ